MSGASVFYGVRFRHSGMDYKQRQFYVSRNILSVCSITVNRSFVKWLRGGYMSPSISISINPEIYRLVVELQNEMGLSISGAGAALIKMGFAWNEQAKMIDVEQNQIKEERIEREAIKIATVKAITQTVKDAQEPRLVCDSITKVENKGQAKT